MNVRWRERKGGNYTREHVAVCDYVCVRMQACECVCAFMRGIRSTFVQDKCTLSLTPSPSPSPHSVSFLFQQRDKSSVRSRHKVPFRKYRQYTDLQ